MGTGASRADSSNQPDAITHSQTSVAKIPSELNNNTTTEKLGSCTENNRRKNSLKSEGGKRDLPPRPTPERNQSETSLQIKKSKVLPPKTNVIQLKPENFQPEKIHDREKKREIKELNDELSASESQRLDLQDHIQLLEEKLASRALQHNVKSTNFDTLQDTVNEKNQCILKLETEAKTNQAEANKMRIKMKKKIRTLTNQLHEVRQESSINQMELKAEILKLEEQINTLKGGRTSSLPPGSDIVSSQDPSHSKIIVELSSQLSEQAEQISSLEAELADKKKEISDLKLAISNHYDSKDMLSNQNSTPQNSILASTSTDRLHSSRGKRVIINDDRSLDSTPQNLNSSSCFDGRNSLERESTALSDSDSDWGDGSIPSHTRSAPARSRVKSAVSLASSGKHKGSLTTLHGNDDSIMDLVSTSPFETDGENRRDSSKRSAYKSRLQKIRTDHQSDSLIGPTLAFEKKADPFSDTSCEPTPRTQRATLQNNSRIRIVRPIVN